MRPPLRAATHEAIFGLLASSGMRVGEAVALQREDVDLDAGVITIRQAKFDRSRLVPLHPSTTEALRRYATERARLCPRPRSGAASAVVHWHVLSRPPATLPAWVCRDRERVMFSMAGTWSPNGPHA